MRSRTTYVKVAMPKSFEEGMHGEEKNKAYLLLFTYNLHPYKKKERGKKRMSEIGEFEQLTDQLKLL
jgi:hypothetical protein